ncbi:non-specific lipid transfer protein GPI-anchored 14-like [Aristolochia californica]|uniref:non-specific lipid transfer protein GPI-anchored 14-like n=1 Tax=Aristolochia californica TaxID=171875 RepID=UPI0035D52DC4
MGKMRLFSVLFLVLLVGARGSMEDDEKECADQLGNLASCIPYVSGSASKPTKQCCDDTVKVRTAKPKCLCVLIKESTDPTMALPVNTTLALKMPSECNMDAPVSDCPSILKLPPDSPDAKIFAEAGADSTSQPSPSSGSSPSSTSGSGSGSVPAPDKKGTPASSDGTTRTTALTSGVAAIALLTARLLA